MNIREKIRQVRLDRALDKINRQCAVLGETFWADMAEQIRGHIAYVADSEAQTRRLGIVKANDTLHLRGGVSAEPRNGESDGSA
jgi:hypothetical protein